MKITPPRYDDVYREGIDALDKEDEFPLIKQCFWLFSLDECYIESTGKCGLYCVDYFSWKGDLRIPIK